jgi:hypothetical protein
VPVDRTPTRFPLLAIASIALLAGCDKPAAPAAKPLAVIVSGDTAGWLMPCGCTANQSGGLLRRATYLADVAKSADAIYLDAGGAAGGDSPYHREKFEAILRGERAMGIIAHNLGKSEIALSAAYLRETSTKIGVPFISANVTDNAGAAVAPASVHAKAGGRTILIVGVASPKFAAAGLKVDDPRQAVLAAIAQSGTAHDGVIVLAYLPEDELAALAAALPEVDAVIGGPTGQAIAPRKVGALMAAATNKGKFLIRLDSPAKGQWDGKVAEVGPAIADAPDQTANLKDFLKRLEARNFSATESGVAPPTAAAAPADFRVAGSAACATCHAADHDTWKATKHAHAFETLQSKGFHVDSQCQYCHTTGFAQPGGFERLTASPKDLQAVGCESCHGPSAAHAKSPTRRTPWAAVDQCKRCHDHENSPTFDYPTYWPRIKHGVKVVK